MAKIKYGAIITDSRGSIGGHSLTATRWGPQIITKPLPRGSRTTAQTLSAARFANLAKNWWEGLSPAQRTAWRALAASAPRPNVWGTEYPLTGLSLYIGLNAQLAVAGLAMTDDAPADQFVTAPATVTLSVTAPSTASITWTTTPLPTDHILYARVAGPLSPGITNISGRYKHLGVSGGSQSSPWDVSSLFSSKLGTLITGRLYAVQVAMLNTSNAALSAFVANTTIAA